MTTSTISKNSVSLPQHPARTHCHAIMGEREVIVFVGLGLRCGGGWDHRSAVIWNSAAAPLCSVLSNLPPPPRRTSFASTRCTADADPTRIWGAFDILPPGLDIPGNDLAQPVSPPYTISCAAPPQVRETLRPQSPKTPQTPQTFKHLCRPSTGSRGLCRGLPE